MPEGFVFSPGCLHRQCLSLASRRASAGQQAGANGEREFCRHSRAVGYPISDPMAALLRDNGIEPSPFEARRLSEQMLKEADLVLCDDACAARPRG
jgi:protein-tyrosine-phosphatase